MTALQFKEELSAYCKASGVSWVLTSDTTNMYRMINRGVKAFSRQCFTKWEPKQTLTLVATQREYDLSLMWWPEVVMINGSPLIHPDLRTVDPVDPGYLYDKRKTYMTAGGGTPTVWWRSPGRNSIMFDPIPDAVLSNNFVAGYLEHDLIDGDADVVDVQEHIAGMCIMFVAKCLQFPSLSGSGVVEQILAEDQRAAMAIEAYAQENRARTTSLGHRGAYAREIRL